MILTETPIPGAYLIEADRFEDERGSFTRIYSQAEFEAQGVQVTFGSAAVSYNRRRGTLRGMHYQAPPNAQAKLVRCTRGAIFDVLIDLRVGSRTFRQWFGFELSASNMRAAFVPEGLAHGFLTLEDSSEVSYLLTGAHSAAHEYGVRWDDPLVGVRWPFAPVIMSGRDASFPDWLPAEPR